MVKPRPDLQKIATVLRTERVRRGLTQPKLAAMYGISQTQISDLERGATRGTRGLSPEIETFLERFLGAIPLELADVGVPDVGRTGDPAELQRALALVRELYHDKPRDAQREHDWQVLLALLERPHSHERRRSGKEK